MCKFVTVKKTVNYALPINRTIYRSDKVGGGGSRRIFCHADNAQTALNQINEKKYAGRFKMDGKKLFKVGVSFSSTEKNIVDWKVA